MTNKDLAIQEIESLKPRKLGSGIRMGTLEEMAASNSPDMSFAPDMEIYTDKPGQIPVKKAVWITLGVSIALVGIILGLIKYQIIKI
jgi:hypothetical protein